MAAVPRRFSATHCSSSFRLCQGATCASIPLEISNYSSHISSKMPHTLYTDIEIAASPAQVWAVLLDFATYKNWNPFIVSVEGSAKEGAQLATCIRPPGGREMRFKPSVTVVEEGRAFEWLGSFGFRGIFDGRHRFELSETENGGTKFVQKEEFTGLLVWLIKNELNTKTKQGFQEMNEALKKRAEEAAKKA